MIQLRLPKFKNIYLWNTRSLSQPSNSTYDAMEFRHWIKSKDQDNKEQGQLTISSFNILSRHYAYENLFPYAGAFLQWEYRFPLINETINQLKCDIMCFQEMEYQLYEKYWRKMLVDYESHFVRKPPAGHWCKAEKFMDGVSIFVNSKRFEVQDKLEVHLAKLITQNTPGVTRDLYERVMSKNTVALILKLYDKLHAKIVYVANTHLYWSPKHNDVKVLQTKLLLNALNNFIDDPYQAHIILAGDFNANSQSNVFKLIDSKSNPSRTINITDCPEFSSYDYGIDNNLISHKNEIKNPIELTSSYHSIISRQELNFTTYCKDFTDEIDHIFISPNNLRTSYVLGGVNSSYLSQPNITGFPNKHFPSDHIPLVSGLYYM